VEAGPNGKVALKQNVSGLYLGGKIQNGTQPIFVQHCKDWEQFTLENRGNGGFAIKSHQNTYLVNENGALTWRQNPEGGR